MSYIIRAEKALMQMPLAKALPCQQHALRSARCKYTVSLSEGRTGAAWGCGDTQPLGTWSITPWDASGEGWAPGVHGTAAWLGA